MTDRDEIALKILSDEINRRQAELINLEASYRRMGGVFDGDDDAPAPKPKLLTGPKSKPAKKKGQWRNSLEVKRERDARKVKATFRLNGQEIEMNARNRDVLEILKAAAGVPVRKSDLLSCFAGPTPNWNQTQNKINDAIAIAGVQIVNVHGQGWKLEKIAA